MLSQLFNLAKLSGKREIKEVVVKPTKDSLSVLATSPDESIAVNLLIKSNDLGITAQIGLTNIVSIQKYIALFGEEPKIVVKDNRLILSKGRKRISSLLKEAEYVTSKIGKDKYDTIRKLVEDGEEVQISSDDVKKIKDYLNATGVEAFKLTVEGKEILVEVGGANTDTITDVIDIPNKVANKVSVVLGQAFIDATTNLSGTITLVLKNDSPVLVKAEATTYKYEALVALFG